MRTLFLTAKKFAIDSNATEITLDHLKKALDAVEFIDNDAKKVVCDYLDVTPSLHQVVSKENIDAASKHGSVKFNEKVKSFKTHLESKGFALSAVATRLFVEKKNALAAFKEQLGKLEESLQSQVFGQDSAIEAVCDKIVESSYNISKNTPKAIYFFLGPPATGKTMLSELMGKELDGYDAFRIFDMTQFTDEESGLGLFGSEAVYKGAEEGKLTKFVKENPKSVIVFDEIEKTHPGVMSNFLMMLSSGKAEDTHSGETIDFTQTIVVFTSNLGSELYNNQNFIDLMKENPQEANSTIIEAIGREEKLVQGRMVKALSPEMLSRLSQGQIVLFNKLPYEALLNIAKSKVLEAQEGFEKEFGLSVEYQDFTKLISALILSLAPLIDVRKMKAKLPLFLFDLITDFIRNNDTMIEKIVFSLDEASQKLIQDELLGLEPLKQTEMLHTLFRKNETFSYKVNRRVEGEVLHFELADIKRKKLARSVDFSGDDGLVFQVPNLSFKNVAGHNIAKKRLSEIINILKEPQKLGKFDVGSPKGMLLYGVPGTGKTMLAKAFANEADLPFIQTTGSEILDIDLMKKIFKKAQEYAPSIVFIDEIDAIGKRNGSNKDIIINQFLTELNGFSDNADEMVFVIAATNLKEKIDDAILRSGRIDLHVEIDALDREAREFFVDKILEKPTHGDFDKDKILTFTAGMTGADLEKVARESALYVFRNNLDAITQEILIEQINTIKYGSRITHKSISKLMESTAIHEAGHAVISRILMPEVKIEQITVVPRNDALGFVSYDQDGDLSNLTRQDIKNKMCVAFAGREAQLKEYGEEGFDSGASSDLRQATRYAYFAIAHYGMDNELGYVNINGIPNISNETQGVTDTTFLEVQIQTRVDAWLKEAQVKTAALIEEHWDKVSALSLLVQEREIVNEAELLELMA
ncbi:MAG: AAA family ATPase [Sulfurimonadaceae bacterium]